jgi:lysine biosynthesis protein LysW
MHEARCPKCSTVIDRDNPRVGAIITCNKCGTELEIISNKPFEVDFTLDYGQDWDDEDSRL